MSTPDFLDPFNTFYDQYSIHEADFVMPGHFDRYVPDNQVDYQCISVIIPNPAKGAIGWTYGDLQSETSDLDQWITIGIYRDEGRVAAQRPARTGISWVRSGYTLTLTDPNGHHLHTGDAVNLTNVNVSNMTNAAVTVINSNVFTVRSLIAGGSTSGTSATYQDDFLTDFYANYRVFRLLPSFKLVPYSVIKTIFLDTAPIPQTALKTLYNITSGLNVPVPPTTSDNTNFLSPTTTIPTSSKSPLAVRFGQVYDAAGDPLPLQYLGSGTPVVVNNVDSVHKNEQIFYTPPRVGTSDPRIYVYDFYGLDLNDSTRGPTYSSVNVTRNLAVSGDLNNLVINPSLGYSSTLGDIFGNLAIGVQTNNALVIRKQVLPLTLDAFNRPTKSPA